MKAVFDTNILIDYLNGFGEAAKELSLYDDKIISVITRVEIRAGARSRDQEIILRNFLASFTVVGLDNRVADRTIDLRRTLRLKIPDAVIYATAREQGCMLVSRNPKISRKSGRMSEFHTHFDLLRVWADILNHPIREWFGALPFWHNNQGRNPKEASAHFFSLKAIRPDLGAVLLLDGDNRNLSDREIKSDGLSILHYFVGWMLTSAEIVLPVF